MFLCCFQAIQHPSDEALQEQAWAAVVPLVGKLKKFYEFSQRLGLYLPALCPQEHCYVAEGGGELHHWFSDWSSHIHCFKLRCPVRFYSNTCNVMCVTGTAKSQYVLVGAVKKCSAICRFEHHQRARLDTIKGRSPCPLCERYLYRDTTFIRDLNCLHAHLRYWLLSCKSRQTCDTYI